MHPIDSLLHPDAHLVKDVRPPILTRRPQQWPGPNRFPKRCPQKKRRGLIHHLRSTSFRLELSLASRSFLGEVHARGAA